MALYVLYIGILKVQGVNLGLGLAGLGNLCFGTCCAWASTSTQDEMQPNGAIPSTAVACCKAAHSLVRCKASAMALVLRIIRIVGSFVLQLE